MLSKSLLKKSWLKHEKFLRKKMKKMKKKAILSIEIQQMREMLAKLLKKNLDKLRIKDAKISVKTLKRRRRTFLTRWKNTEKSMLRFQKFSIKKKARLVRRVCAKTLINKLLKKKNPLWLPNHTTNIKLSTKVLKSILTVFWNYDKDVKDLPRKRLLKRILISLTKNSKVRKKKTIKRKKK
jgi:hypothetical protein